MTLEAILKDFPNIRLAKQADNEALLEFYAKSQLTTSKQNIVYKRGNDFFAFMKEKSKDYLVFILFDDSNKIQGLATVNYRPGFIDGVETIVGYLGDLRVNLQRKLIRQWRKMYTLFISHSPELPETHYCRHYLTALISENFFSRNNLANNRIERVKYKLVERYHMINILGGPLLQTTKSPFHIAPVKKSDWQKAQRLFYEDHRSRQFGLKFPEELNYRLKRWEGFMKNNIFGVYRNEKLIAAFLFWGPSRSKQIEVNFIPNIFQFLNYFFKIIPLYKVLPLPKPSSPLKIKYLHQISFEKNLSICDKKVIFPEIIKFLLRTNSNLNIIAYCDYQRENYSSLLRSFITYKKPMALYSVHDGEDEENIRDPLALGERTTAFDMSLV